VKIRTRKILGKNGTRGFGTRKIGEKVGKMGVCTQNTDGREKKEGTLKPSRIKGLTTSEPFFSYFLLLLLMKMVHKYIKQ
jgi:hypothetical protein